MEVSERLVISVSSGRHLDNDTGQGTFGAHLDSCIGPTVGSFVKTRQNFLRTEEGIFNESGASIMSSDACACFVSSYSGDIVVHKTLAWNMLWQPKQQVVSFGNMDCWN